MAPLMADPKSLKSNKCLKRARIIGRIRAFTEQESKSVERNSISWITVKNPHENGSNENSTVFFDTQSTSRKDVYELDYCYDQHDGIDQIYSREVKSLILEAFDGQNASIIAVGARGSGKTYTIQGSEEKPGLVVMAMPEILSKARDLGKSVYVSIYEMTQEHVYDILDPNRQEIQVMEDGHGKINFKGLSQVHVKSISEFHGMYFTQKAQMDQTRKHKGVMVHILCEDHKSKSKMANKINFVDLAGYEDPKKGGGLAEINRTNKSLYALVNVVNALNANEIRMPYRESNLTRILQDSLGGTCNVLLLTCLNPTICQDTITALSLVSRSYRSVKQVLVDSTNRSQSIGKQKVPSSLKSGKTISASLSVKKIVGQSHLRDTKKGSCNLKGRKLFDDKKRINSKQLGCQSEDTSAQKSKILQDLVLVVSPFSLEEAQPHKSVSETCSPIKKEEDENREGHEFQSMSKLDTSFSGAHDDKTVILAEKDVSPGSQNNHLEPSLDVKSVMAHEDASTCEETNTFRKEEGSPLLSERIREISNSLKALCSSTPLRIKMVEEKVATNSTYDVLEPKTPVVKGLGSVTQYSPGGTFSHRSLRVKDSLVNEYLKFLNSASKDELKGIRGIGEKRANYIIELREDSPEPFKNLDDLQDIGLSAKQVKGMMKQVAGELF